MTDSLFFGAHTTLFRRTAGLIFKEANTLIIFSHVLHVRKFAMAKETSLNTNLFRTWRFNYTMLSAAQHDKENVSPAVHQAFTLT